MNSWCRLVQRTFTTASSLSGFAANWRTTPIVGNLLVVCYQNAGTTAATWTNGMAAGYSLVGTTPYPYGSAGNGQMGMCWKIAAASEPTPGGFTRSVTSASWEMIGFEFYSATGWVTSAIDQLCVSAAGVTATTRTTATSPVLTVPHQIGVVMHAHTTTTTGFPSWSNSPFYLDSDVGNLSASNFAPTKIHMGWNEIDTLAGVKTTATTAISSISGDLLATFKGNIREDPQHPPNRSKSVAFG